MEPLQIIDAGEGLMAISADGLVDCLGDPFVGLAIKGTAAVITVIYKSFRSGQNEYISAYDPRDRSREPCWVVATEEGWGNVRVCRYESESRARAAFDSIWCSRILYNPDSEEVTCAGVNWLAHPTIRRVMKGHYFA